MLRFGRLRQSLARNAPDLRVSSVLVSGVRLVKYFFYGRTITRIGVVHNTVRAGSQVTSDTVERAQRSGGHVFVRF
jgi:hypothetical protein